MENNPCVICEDLEAKLRYEQEIRLIIYSTPRTAPAIYKLMAIANNDVNEAQHKFQFHSCYRRIHFPWL